MNSKTFSKAMINSRLQSWRVTVWADHCYFIDKQTSPLSVKFARSCWISSALSAFSRAATASLKFITLLLPAKLPKELVIYQKRYPCCKRVLSILCWNVAFGKLNFTHKLEIQPLFPICQVFCKPKTNFEIQRLTMKLYLACSAWKRSLTSLAR